MMPNRNRTKFRPTEQSFLESAATEIHFISPYNPIEPSTRHLWPESHARQQKAMRSNCVLTYF